MVENSPRTELGRIIPEPEIQTPLQYVADFAREAKHARKRVWSQAMLFEANHGSFLMLNALDQAAQRKLDVRFTYDAYTDVEIDGKMIALPAGEDVKTEREIHIRNEKDWREKIAESRGAVTVTNPRKFLKYTPVFGRNHIKLSIIDDIAWVGGVNPASDHFERADFMVKTQDPDVVSALSNLFQKVNDDRPTDDYKVDCNDKYSLYVDSGKKRQSIIYDEAIVLARTANSSIQFMSQIPPSGRLLKEMVEAADRGVDVNILLSDEKHYQEGSIPFGVLKRVLYNRFKNKIGKHPEIKLSHFTGNLGMVHAKLLIIDGQKALWGSHNLSPAGVYAGTQEASLVTTDEVLVRGLTNTFSEAKLGSFDLGFQEGPFNPRDNS